MKFVDALTEFLNANYARIKEIKIKDFSIGLKYSYVVISDGNTNAIGLCLTPLEDAYIYKFAEEPNINNIIERMKDLNILNRVLSLALINAISQYLLAEKFEKEDNSLTDLIDGVVDLIDNKDKVIVIGNMIPLVNRIKEITDGILVFERNPKLRINAYPDILELEFLKDADVLIITGATLINSSIDYILKFANPSSIKIIVGPTAQTHPEVLKRIGINHVCSIRIPQENIENVIRIIKLGGGRWSFSKFGVGYCV